jgi:hypothetical protein
MNGNRRTLSLFSLILAAAAPVVAEPVYFTFPGHFTQDSDRADFVFTILSLATVELESLSP